MADTLKPNKKYGHLYAIIRYESDEECVAPIDIRVTVKKVVSDAHYAATEVQRLNALNKDKGSYYFYQITRFEEVPVEVRDVSSLRSAESDTAAVQQCD